MNARCPSLITDRSDIDEDGCWIWKLAPSGPGADRGQGYGLIGVDGKRWWAHRISYEIFVGPIPQGMQIDHLCRKRMCVNPAHLEAVTHRENLMRGATITGLNARKTHCIHGHEFTPENTQATVLKSGGEGRACITCEKAKWGRQAQRRRESRHARSLKRAATR